MAMKVVEVNVGEKIPYTVSKILMSVWTSASTSSGCL